METSFERNELLKRVVKNNEVKKLIDENQVPINSIDKNLTVLLAFDLRSELCKNCKGLYECKQLTTGYKPDLSYDDVKFDINYAPCKYQEEENESTRKENNLKFIASSMDRINLDDIYINNARKDVLQKIKTCIDSYEKNVPTKGLYIHGNYGCGKTYLLTYMAKTLADDNHKVIFAYYPGLARMFRSAISDGSLEALIEDLKEVEVLFLDDFGGETMSSYIRDEILGAILQERMSNNLLTFMSSNLDETLLMAHLKESNKDIDELRASRIYERIRALMEFVKLVDNNYRS